MSRPGRKATPSSRRDWSEAVFASLRRRLTRRDDSGQVIVIVLILVILLAAIGPVMVFQITSDAPLLTSSSNTHAALAAAEAGIQWYRDNLNTSPGYYSYSASNNVPSDPALSGYCSSQCQLGATSPQEAFHYVPVSYLGSQTGGAAGAVALTVTGRAGTPGSYSYVHAEAYFSPTSILDNAYFSNFEILDPNSATAQAFTVSVSGSNTPPQETNYQITYSYTTASGSTSPPVNSSLWTAMCQYYTYSPNNFIDSLGMRTPGGSNTYSSTYPYYGPYFGGSFTFKLDGSTVSPTGSTTVSVSAQPCGDAYDFVNGESFNGPVYSNDQLHVCGSPSFLGAPTSLTSGASNNTPYVWQVPGSIPVTGANQAQYPYVLPGAYVPAGYTTDPVNCGATNPGGNAGSDTPLLSHGPVQLNGGQSLPSLNTALAQYGTKSPPSGLGYGCTFVGPTMIELVTTGGATGTTTMDVWSPLSTDTSITDPRCANMAGQSSSSFSATTPFLTQIPLPTDGVIYVEDDTLATDAQGNVVSPPSVPSDGSTPCFNPYRSTVSVRTPSCYEGDVYVEGELNSQLTIGTSANIIVTRDLTYACADGSGGANPTDPSSVPGGACNSATPNVLGLSAKYDVLVSGNDPTDTSTSAQSCTSGFGDGTGSPVNTPTSGQARAAPYGRDPALANDPAAVWPTLCNPRDIIIDAAVFALNGSFGVENWCATPNSGNTYLNGADLSEYRGPFGSTGIPGCHGSSGSGYSKHFSLDQRLQYAQPPQSPKGTVATWRVDNYIVCPTSTCPAIN